MLTRRIILRLLLVGVILLVDDQSVRAVGLSAMRLDGAVEPLLKITGPLRRDVGSAAIEEILTHRREIENISGWTAALRVLSSSCPCVKVVVEPKEIPAGGRGSVSIAVPVAPVASEQAHWARIEASFAGPNGLVVATEQFDVQITYEADLSFLVQPTRLWMSLAQGGETERVVYIRSRAIDALGPRDFRTEGEGLSVRGFRRFKVPTPERPGEEALAVTVVAKGGRPGITTGRLIFSTNDKRFPVAGVPIDVRVRDLWVAEPAGFPLIVTRADQQVEQSVRVFARDHRHCPASGAFLCGEDGISPGPAGIEVRMEKGSSDTEAVVKLMADFSRISSSDGLASVTIVGNAGEVLLRLPIAWVRPVAAPSPQRDAQAR